MRFVYNDGGRSNYFKVGNVGDCCCRAICNTTGLDYKRIYDLINKISVLESTKHHRRGQTSSARDGVFKETAIKIIEALGGEKVKVQEFGSSIKCHLCDEDLNQYNKGSYLLILSKHYSSLINGDLVDTYDCSRDGDRQVYSMYKMNKTLDEYNKLLEAFEVKMDKKVKNKISQNEVDERRNVRINKRLNEIEQQIINTRNTLNRLIEERNELRRKLK